MAPTLPSLLASAESGDRAAVDALFAALYDELHRLARFQLSRRGGGVTLGATTLLHEAYLEMAGRKGASFAERGRFMAYAARVMRGLIVDYARNRGALKRGGGFELLPLGTDPAQCNIEAGRLAQLSDALDDLAEVDPTLAQVVDLKFFCGFSFAEIGAMRGACERTVQRQWEKARIWLHGVVGDEELP